MRRKKAPRTSGGFTILPTETWSDLETAFSNRMRLAKGETVPGVTVPAGSSADSQNKSSWSGTDTPEEALRYLSGGWQEGTRAVAEGLDRVMVEMAGAASWELDVCGAFVEVGAFVSGDAECMWSRTQEPAPAPRIRIVIEACYSASVGADNVRRYAVALAATLRKLEAEGMDIEAIAVDVRSNYGSGTVVKAIEVRKFGQPLDLSKIAFAGHPAFLRRALFALCELDDGYPVGCRSGGYGSVSPLTDAMLAAGYVEGADLAVKLPAIQHLAPTLATDADVLGKAVPAMLAAIREGIKAKSL